jgi:hypothetical protein
MIVKSENKKWLEENQETVLGQLVLYHSPVALATVVMHPEKFDDAFLEKLKLRLEKSEGLIETQKQERKKVADKLKKQKKKAPVVEETDDEANLRFVKEKAAETEKKVEEHEKEKLEGDELPD